MYNNVKILSTRKTSALIEEIVTESKNFVLIVSPYLKISDSLYERLVRKLNLGIRVVLLFGKVDSNFSQYQKLRDHNKSSIFFLDKLHAKIYANEDIVLVSSMNLHSYSEINNWEIGLQEDSSSSEYKNIFNEVLLMLKASTYKFGDKDYSIIDLSNGAHEFIGILQETIKTIDFRVIEIQTGWDDEKSYTFKGTYQPKQEISMIFNFNHLAISSDSEDDLRSICETIESKGCKSGLRCFQKSYERELAIYPPDGFNARRDNMEIKEYRAMWISILEDIEKVLCDSLQAS